MTEEGKAVLSFAEEVSPVEEDEDDDVEEDASLPVHPIIDKATSGNRSKLIFFMVVISLLFLFEYYTKYHRI